MPTLIAHPTGNQFFRAAVGGLYNHRELAAAFTCVANFKGELSFSLSKLRPFGELKRRSFDTVYRPFFHTYPQRELLRLLAVKLNLAGLTKHETGRLSVDSIYRSFDSYVSRQIRKYRDAASIYCYEDGAYESFKEAKRLGMRCIYDLPIGYWRQMHELLHEEKKNNPLWSSTLEGLRDSREKLNRKDDEIAMADVIIVASSFTKNSLAYYKGRLPRIKIIPYGFPPARSKKYRAINGKLKLLYVGSLGQRKGISYLFQALNGLECFCELTIIGRGNIHHNVRLRENLAKHQWIESLPHSEVLEKMRQSDVLIFPSLFEGFGQVITEAMAQGTPVITTERTAGPDLIRHGENGWVVNAASSDEIRNLLEEIIHNPGIIAYAGKQALETAEKRPWSVYGSELASVVTAADNGRGC